ncbi:unnamed protein product [marine sediment metagenome]|uniref:Uncharacterized protein n=1 Tax=marine sediment metagenome TaxID=412755 RepID=X1S5Q8_9ZZZZ
MSYLVRIQNDRTQLSQQLRHRALATTYTTSKTDNLHWQSSYPSLATGSQAVKRLVIYLTPLIPLSFKGEGEGSKPLTTPGKRLDFDSGASSRASGCEVLFSDLLYVVVVFVPEFPEVPHLATFLAGPDIIVVYHPVVNTLASLIPGHITLGKAPSAIPTLYHRLSRLLGVSRLATYLPLPESAAGISRL